MAVGHPSIRAELPWAAQLLDSASVLRSERLSAEQLRIAEQEAAALERRLAAVRGKEEATWRHIEELIGTKKPSGYDTAVSRLADLRALAQSAGGTAGFSTRLAELRTAHRAKPSLIQRLDGARMSGVE